MSVKEYFIQSSFSIISAIVVVILSYFISKRHFIDQQWWEKKANKYEETIYILANLERIYDDLQFETSNDSEANWRRFPEYSKLKTSLDIITATASLYFDNISESKLIWLRSLIFEKDLELRFGDDHKQLYAIRNGIVETKEIIIKSAVKKLKKR